MREHLTREVDRDLGLERSLELEAHLSICKPCRDHRASLLLLERALLQMDGGKVRPPDLERSVAQIRARIRALPPGARQAEVRSISRLWKRPMVWTALAAALAATFVLVRRVGPKDDAQSSLHSTLVVATDREHTAPHQTPDQLPDQVPDQLPDQAPPQPDEHAQFGAARRAAKALMASASRERDFSTASRQEVVQSFAHLELEITRRVPGALGAGLDRSGLLRLASESLGGADVSESAVAARWLGAFAKTEGTSSHVRTLARALERQTLLPTSATQSSSSLTLALAMALEDCGLGGLTALAQALDQPHVAPVAERALRAAGSEAALPALQSALTSKPESTKAMHLLASTGAQGRAALLDLARRRKLDQGLALDALASNVAVAEAGFNAREYASLALELVDSARSSSSTELAMLALTRMPAQTAEFPRAQVCAWLRERAVRGEWRSLVPPALAAVGGCEAASELLALDLEALAPAPAVRAAMAELLARSAPGTCPVSALLEHQREALGPERLEHLMELVAASEEPHAVQPLMQLAGMAEMDVHARALALLAAGELGSAADLELFRAGVRQALVFVPASHERLLLAAGLVAAHRLAAAEGAELLLQEHAQIDAKSAQQVFALLAAMDRSPSMPSLFKLARQLDPWIRSRKRDSAARTSLGES